MKKQKGFSAALKNLTNSYSDTVDLLPELPGALRKVINLLNNDQLNLDRNLKNLDHIENSIFKSTRRN